MILPVRNFTLKTHHPVYLYNVDQTTAGWLLSDSDTLLNCAPCTSAGRCPCTTTPGLRPSAVLHRGEPLQLQRYSHQLLLIRHPQGFSRWGVKCEAFVGKSNLSIAARVRTSGIYLRATFAGNVSHRLHIGFEDSSKSEGVVTRHCHFAESLGMAVNNCYICGNSKREYAQG